MARAPITTDTRIRAGGAFAAGLPTPLAPDPGPGLFAAGRVWLNVWLSVWLNVWLNVWLGVWQAESGRGTPGPLTFP